MIGMQRTPARVSSVGFGVWLRRTLGSAGCQPAVSGGLPETLFPSMSRIVRIEGPRHSGCGQQASSLRSPEKLRVHLAGTP